MAKLGHLLEAMYRPSLHDGDTGENDGKRYKVIRFHKDGPSKTIAKGLTLGQARHHVKDPETSSSTGKGRNARRYTKAHGPWFDGYDLDEETETGGEPLLEATKPAKKSTGTAITIKVGNGSGGKSGDAKGEKKSSGGSTRKASPQAQRAKGMSEMLKATDEAAIFHRQKGFEHGQWEEFHNLSRMDRHLAPIHKEIREKHEDLRKSYMRLSNEAYRITRPENKKLEKKKLPEKKKNKGKTLKECLARKEIVSLDESKEGREHIQKVLKSVVARGKPVDWAKIAPPRPSILTGAKPKTMKECWAINEYGELAMAAMAGSAVGSIAGGALARAGEDIYHHAKHHVIKHVGKLLSKRQKQQTASTPKDGGTQPTTNTSGTNKHLPSNEFA